MRENNNTVLLRNDSSDDQDFMKAFKEAIKDPEKRKQIISILETYGLLPFAEDLPA